MATNDRSQITEDEINQLKKFRGKVKDFLNGVERWLPEDNPDKTPEQLAALREMEKYPRKDSLYTPKELTAILKEDKFRCWHKTQILFSEKNFKSIKRIIEPRWTEWSIFKKAWDEIGAIIERGPETNSFEPDTNGRFRPGCAASERFLSLIESLDYTINKLAERERVERIRDDQCGQDETTIPDYRALDLAKRTVTIGTKTHSIISERVWDFLKDLHSALRDDRLVPMLEGAANNKNNVDQLRKQIGRDALHGLVISVRGGYKLNPEVKILQSAQFGMRKTRLSHKRT